MFFPGDKAQHIATGPAAAVVDFYDDADNDRPYRRATASGAVAFAGTTDDERRLAQVDCTQLTIALTLPANSVTDGDLADKDCTAFMPTIETALVRPKELSTTGTGLPPATAASYTADWRNHGFDAANPG